MALEDKAAKHRLHHGVSHCRDNRLAKKHHEQLLLHVLGMPSYIAEENLTLTG